MPFSSFISGIAFSDMIFCTYSSVPRVTYFSLPHSLPSLATSVSSYNINNVPFGNLLQNSLFHQNVSPAFPIFIVFASFHRYAFTPFTKFSTWFFSVGLSVLLYVNKSVLLPIPLLMKYSITASKSSFFPASKNLSAVSDVRG